ncbi:MAG: hypothetical protein RIT45_3952 [Pseudomonadota bacterium]
MATALRERAAASPQALALVDARTGEVQRYGALWSAACGVAERLAAAGVVPGDVVGVCGANGLSLVADVYGVLAAGATLMPISPRDAPVAVAERLDRVGARWLLGTDEGRAGTLLRRLVADGDGTRTWLRSAPSEARADAGAPPPPYDWPAPRRAEDAALLLFTSGTTGRSRGVRIGHGALVVHTRELAHGRLGLRPDDVIWGALPLSHSFGARMVLLAACFAGARVVLVPHPDPATDVEACARHGVTWIPAVPTLLHGLADAARSPLPTLRWCLSAGAPLAEPLRQHVEARLGAPVYQGYGLTEASFCTVDAPPDLPTAGSVGRPAWGVRVRVVAAGRELEPGQRGEIEVRGVQRMLGDTSEDLPVDAWLATGDVGYLDADGKLFVVDRKKDLILRGGHNVVPAEVEAALLSLPSIRAAIVVGVPDGRLGEAVVAALEPHDPEAGCDLAAIDRALRERLADWQRPSRYAISGSLPVGGSGKLLRRAVRDAIADGSLRTEAP